MHALAARSDLLTYPSNALQLSPSSDTYQSRDPLVEGISPPDHEHLCARQVLFLIAHRINGPEKESIQWLVEDGRKVRCTSESTRGGPTHGGAATSNESWRRTEASGKYNGT